MEYPRLNNLGIFLNLAALWKSYPRGGKEGDYCQIGDYEWFWDKYQNEWISSKDLSSVPSESWPRETIDIYEDINLHHDLNVGGTIRGTIDFSSDSKGFEKLNEYKKILERLQNLDISSDEDKTAISDLKKLAEDLKLQAEKALTAAEESEQYINGVLQEELNGIFTQLDGTIISHFGLYTPTLGNLPASEWKTLSEKEAHLNDTFTNKLDNRSYRWEIKNGNFCWIEIVDQTAATALAAAAKAQDTADGKRRTFTRQPTSADEYEVGDLWVNATYGTLYANDVLRAIEPKAKGAEFDINHWVLASKYTDDEMANEALGMASQAAEDAAALKEMLDKINDDAILDTSEKVHIRTQWELINGTASLNLKGLTGSYYDTIEFARNTGYLTKQKEVSAIAYNGYVITYDEIRVTYPYSSSSDFDLAYEALKDFLIKVKLYSNDYTEGFDRLRMVELFNAYYREETKLFDAAQRYYSLTQAREAIDNFINGEYLDDIQTLKRQLDQSAQTHVQDTDPSEEWADEDTRHTHISDIWWNSSAHEINGVPAGATAIYQSKSGEYYWEVTPVPQSLFDRIDGKAQIFISKPSSYNANDMWILEAEYTLGEITYPTGTMVVAIEGSDKFVSAHWVKKDNYTDNSYVDEAIRVTKEELNEAIEAAQHAADAAGDLAGAAQSAADEAKEDAQTAKDSAHNAQLKAEAATQAAEVAQTAADDAKSYAEGISEVANKAAALAEELQNTKVGSEEYNAKLQEINGLLNDVNSIATEATQAAQKAEQEAEKAQEAANNASNTLTEWAKDEVISPLEKTEIKNEASFIKADNADIEYQRARYQLEDESEVYTKYNNAYLSYLSALDKISNTNGEVAVGNLAELQATFYNARTEILNAIAEAARNVADNAQRTANEAQELAEAAQGAAQLAQETAEQAIEDAKALKTMIDNINDDTVLDIAEKSHIRTQWELINGTASLSICGEQGSYYDTLEVVEKLGYKNGDTIKVTFDGKTLVYDAKTILYQYTGLNDLQLAYEDLRNYLARVKIYANEATDNFNRMEMVGLFNRYYQAETYLLDRAQRFYAETQAANAVDTFIKGEYADDLAAIQKSIDGKSETHMQDTDPADNWNTDELKAAHERDIWWNTADSIISGVPSGATAIYENANGSFRWSVTPVPQSLFDKIDGKATCHTSKPSSYKINDLWVLESEYTINGKKYSAGTIVFAMQSSDTFDISHWAKKDNYTDDTAADEAKDLAGAAQEAANNAQKDADQAKDDAANAQGAADDAKQSADNAQQSANNAQQAADDAKQTAESAMKIAQNVQTSAENLQKLYEELDGSKVGTEEYNSKVAELVNESSRIETIASDAKNLADAAEKKAKEAIEGSAQAQEIASKAKTTLDEWSADDVISPFEKQSVSDELAFIVADKDDIDYQKGIYVIDDEDSLYSAYNTAFSKYKTYLTTLTASNEAISLQPDFDTIQATFYDTRTAILTAIASAARKVADLAKEAADAAQTLANEADEAARKALEAADKLQVMLETINDDNTLDIIEKRNIRTQWELINGTESLSTSGSDGSYNKALVLAESLGYKNAKSLPVVITYGGTRITYSGKTPTYAYMGTADLELAYETLREYLRTIRLYGDVAQPGFSRQEFASILTAYYVAESALINSAQTYYTESQKQIALDEAEKALKAAGVSQEILGVTEDLLESVDEADCILTVIEKNSLKQIYSVISDLTEVFVYGEDSNDVALLGNGTFHAIFNEAFETSPDNTSTIIAQLCSAFTELQRLLISKGDILSSGSTVVSNTFRADLYQKLGLYLSQEEKTRIEISKVYTGTIKQDLADNMAKNLGYADYQDLKEFAENKKETIIKGGRLNTALIEANAITAAMIAVENLFSQVITATRMTLAEGCTIKGRVSIASDKILLDTDGSGHLAGAAISWDSSGNGLISGAWNNPIGSQGDALNRTVFLSSTTIGSINAIYVGSYNSANVSASAPMKKIGSITLISNNNELPLTIGLNDSAVVVVPRIEAVNKAVASLRYVSQYFMLAPGSITTFDVYDDYNEKARCLRPISPMGWFNKDGVILPYSYDGASYEALSDIKIYHNAIGASMTGGVVYKVIDLPARLIQYMKLKVGGKLSSSYDSNIYFQRVEDGTVATTYTVSKLLTETDIIHLDNAISRINYRNGGSFGFGIVYSGSQSISYSPTLYVKLYDSGSMIGYFQITL